MLAQRGDQRETSVEGDRWLIKYKFNLKEEQRRPIKSSSSCLSWMLPLVSKKEETPGQTQDTRERLHLPLGLGTPQHPPRGQGGSSQGWSGAPVFAAQYRIRWNDLGRHVLISLAEESSGLLSLTNNWMRVFLCFLHHSSPWPPPPFTSFSVPAWETSAHVQCVSSHCSPCTTVRGNRRKQEHK